MHRPNPRPALLLGGLLALTLAGCGGGGSGGDASPAPAQTPVVEAPSAVTLAGVVATGAAFTDAVVTVTDSTGAAVGTSGTVGDDGRFSVTLSAGAKAPFVLVAERAALNGQTERLVSVAGSGTTGNATVNLTPVTTLIAALLSPSGDPDKLAGELSSGAAALTDTAVASKVSQVQTMLAPLIAATGTAGTDPLSGSFVVNGTGYDRLLDSVHVQITPASATSSNIEVSVRQQAADGVAPTAVSFSSTAATPVQLPAVDAGSLVADGTSVRIAALLSGLTACYAVPFADRVEGVVGDATAVRGGPADVKAPACRTLFVGADPASYLSNGARVGRDANNAGAFSGLFRLGATGAVFSQGGYDFTRGNGDLVVSYKVRDASGNASFDTLVVRLDAADGKLKLIGNQYAHGGSVVPYQQLRQFVTLGQSAYDYRSSGYVLNVPNATDGAGRPLYNRVEVTTPRGNVLTLRPTTGYSYLGLVKGNATLGTNFLRLRSAFNDAATQGDLPAMEPSLFFSNTPFSDDEMAAIPAQAVWTYRYFLAGNTGGTPDAVQNYKTRARALNIGELGQRRLTALTAGVVAQWQASASPTSGVVPLPTDGPFSLGDPAAGGGWTVADGAMPATSVTLFGSHRGTGFNDVASFGSTARTASVRCDAATAGDQHCSSATAGAFASGAVATGLHLWARDAAGREYANFYAAYKLVLP